MRAFSITCQLSHLGRVSLRTVAEVNTAIGVQVAEITYTAARGEMLFAGRHREEA